MHVLLSILLAASFSDVRLLDNSSLNGVLSGSTCVQYHNGTWAQVCSPADGQITLENAAGSAGVLLDVSTTAVCKVESLAAGAATVQVANLDSVSGALAIGPANASSITITPATTVTGQIVANGGITAPGSTGSEAFGASATTSTFQRSTVLGNTATATQADSTVIGYHATNTGQQYATVVGASAAASGGIVATAVGQSATATGASTTAVGGNANASALQATAIGKSASADTNSTAIGAGSTATGGQATALGAGASATGALSTALGQGATSSGSNAIAIGLSASNSAGAAHSISIGNTAATTSQFSIAIGDAAASGGNNNYGVALGASTIASGLSVAIGKSATTSTFDNALAIGQGATATGANDGEIGSSSFPINLNVNGTLASTGQSYTQKQTKGATWSANTANTTLTFPGGGAATEATTNLIPAGAQLVGYSARVIVAGTTCTSWEMGDGTTANLYAPSGTSLAQGTTVTPANAASNPFLWHAAVSNFTITSVGSNCVNLSVRITYTYSQSTADTAN